jgi:AraC-like DNA-binding protein
MPLSLASVFGEADDFEAALRAEGVVELLITGRGPYRARLTQISLHRFRLAAGDEPLPRIAFIEIPAGMILVAFPIEAASSPVWGGMTVEGRDIITIAPGQRVHARTIGPSRWGALQLPEKDLVEYGRGLTGTIFPAPRGVAKWRPSPAMTRQLRDLHRAAIRQAQSRSGTLADGAAAHGLEQQLLHALINCLSAGPASAENPAAARKRDVLARFEELLRADSAGRMTEICTALGVSDRLLRHCCDAHLGMSPGSYRRRRAMQQVHRALRNGDPQSTTVAEVAGRHHFRDLGRFASNYRAIYGELPSTTLRSSSRTIAGLGLGRHRMNFS